MAGRGGKRQQPGRSEGCHWKEAATTGVRMSCKCSTPGIWLWNAPWTLNGLWNCLLTVHVSLIEIGSLCRPSWTPKIQIQNSRSPGGPKRQSPSRHWPQSRGRAGVGGGPRGMVLCLPSGSPWGSWPTSQRKVVTGQCQGGLTTEAEDMGQEP